MKCVDLKNIDLKSGYWFEKEKLNRETTVGVVYEQFCRTGRIKSFDFNWREGEECKPHYFWDSDVAKWMEGAAYVLAKHSDPELENKLDDLIERICIHQCPDGYFNIYFTCVEPSKRFRGRHNHELYCAGHLIEASIACDEIGKPKLLNCMKKYADYIYRVFVEEKSAAFASPGHEEIELALVRLYRRTGEKKYLLLAEHFINVRGTEYDYSDKGAKGFERQIQAHKPVRGQDEAIGHAVRALYLYTGMAMLAKETGDDALFAACLKLFDNITGKKMYITGGVGSTDIGEAFTNAYDLPNDTAYSETCASIAMMFFCRAMLENDNNGRYADIIERVFYNGVLSGLSLNGRSFFYVNALEINLNEHFDSIFGRRSFPITQRPEIFDCSCCPPNLNRLLASLGSYLFAIDGEVLYVNQYASAEMSDGDVSCRIITDYPVSGKICINASGVKTVALRIPGWCETFTLNKPYSLKNGYAFIDNDETEIRLDLKIVPHAVYSNSNVARDAYKLCIMRGPVVYCAEEVDNEPGLHRYSVPLDFKFSEITETASGLPELDISARRLKENSGLYTTVPPETEEKTLHLIPYSSFANRGECDMRVWFEAIY